MRLNLLQGDVEVLPKVDALSTRHASNHLSRRGGLQSRVLRDVGALIGSSHSMTLPGSSLHLHDGLLLAISLVGGGVPRDRADSASFSSNHLSRQVLGHEVELRVGLFCSEGGQVLALSKHLSRLDGRVHLHGLVETLELAIAGVRHQFVLGIRRLGKELLLRRGLDGLVVHVSVDVLWAHRSSLGLLQVLIAVSTELVVDLDVVASSSMQGLLRLLVLDRIALYDTSSGSKATLA